MTPDLAAFLGTEPFTAALIQAACILLAIRLLDVWEREPYWVLGAMALWGAVGSTAIAAPLNGAALEAMSPTISATFGPAIIAPVTEELSKGLALLAAFFASRWLARRYGVAEFNGPTDGMVYGAAIGLGFAFAENNIYFLNTAVEEKDVRAGLAILNMREGFLNLGTLGHAVYTASFGAGLGLAMWARTRVGRIGFPLLGLGVGMFLHAFNNGLIPLMLVSRYGLETTARALNGQEIPAAIATQMQRTAEQGILALKIFDYVIAAAFVLALVAWTVHQRRVLAYELGEEAAGGLITAEEQARLTRFGGRLTWYWQLLISGRVDELGRLRGHHQQLGELAFTKWRLRKTGGDASAVERLRREIRVFREAEAKLAGGP